MTLRSWPCGGWGSKSLPSLSEQSIQPKKEIVDGLAELLGYKGITIKEKKIVQRTLELWREKNVEIVHCYLAASLEKDAQNIIYSYDRDFDKFEVNRKEP